MVFDVLMELSCEKEETLTKKSGKPFKYVFTNEEFVGFKS
jgi:hypothetical protein